MKKFYTYTLTSVLLIAMFCNSTVIYSQIDKSSAFLTDEQLNGGKTVRSDVFNGNSLWGYINGGADIYLEYGFSKVYVQEIRYGEGNFKVELYQMANIESAFGIFTVSTFRCNVLHHENPRHYCETRYQIQYALSDMYVSITNDLGNAESQSYNRQLAEYIKKKIKNTNYSEPDLFQQQPFKDKINDLILVKGELGVQNGFAFWADKFDFGVKFMIHILPLKMNDGRMNLAILEFLSSEERSTFLEQNSMQFRDTNIRETRKESKGEDSWWIYDSNKIIFLESMLPRDITVKYINAVEKFLSD